MRKFGTLILLSLAWLMSTTAQAGSSSAPYSTPYQPLAEGEIQCRLYVEFGEKFVVRTGPGHHFPKAKPFDDEVFDFAVRRNGDWFMVVGTGYYWVHKSDIFLYEVYNNSDSLSGNDFTNEECVRGLYVIHRERNSR